MRQVKLNRTSNNGTMVERDSAQMGSTKIKVKGYQIAVAVGQTDQQIVLPSEAGTLLGFAFDQNISGDFTTNLNNEIVHEKIRVVFACPMGAGGTLGLQPYFPVNRKIFGNDDFKISLNSTVSVTAYIVIYYK